MLAHPLHQAEFLLTVANDEQLPPPGPPEIAFAGRSNAGKSSAINAIAGRHRLARTSKAPGSTRLVNFFELAPMKRLVDLPGYGYASAPEVERRAWRPLLEALRARAALRGLFVIVDSRRGVSPADEALLEWAAPGQRVHVLLSKADKLSRSEAEAALRAAQTALSGRATAQLFSALKGTGVAQAEDKLVSWLAE